jgi:hypothetical protein
MGITQKLSHRSFEWVNAKANQAVDKVGDLSIKKQCKGTLEVFKTKWMFPGFKANDYLLNGMVADYKLENNGGKISVETWLTPYHAEPLFEKVLSKSKVTWAELEAKLKE